MKQRIRLTESDIRSIVKGAVNKVLNEGSIPDASILNGIKEYISDEYSLSQVLKSHPQLLDLIANWLLENGDDDFIRFICTNFIDQKKYL